MCQARGNLLSVCEVSGTHNLILVAGSTFAMPGYVRIAYCVSPDMIKRSLPHFADLAAEYGLKNGI